MRLRPCPPPLTALRGHLLAFGPHDGAHRVAVRASVSVVVPMLVLVATGHTAWTIYAAFGAFTSLYGRERVDLRRVRLQVAAGAALVASVTLGAVVALSEERAWLAVPGTTGVAMAATYVSMRQHWHPPGPLFCVFAFASVAAIPAGPAAIGVATGVSAASAGFAVVVGNAGALIRRVRRTAPLSPDGPPIGGAAVGVWRYAVLAGVGVALAGSVSTAVGIGRPYWGMVSAVVPLVAMDLSVQLTRGVHRVVGTGLGLVVAALLFTLELPAIGVVLVAAVLQALAELLVGRNYAVALVAITPLALLMVHLAAPTPPGTLLVDRGLETLIGVGIGLAVGYVGRPRPSAASVRAA